MHPPKIFVAHGRIIEGKEAHLRNEETESLPDGVARRRQPHIIARKHCQGPSIHGDILVSHRDIEARG